MQRVRVARLAAAYTLGLRHAFDADLPVLFAAGMTLPDTLDGSSMSFAYGWALARPLRKR